MDTLTALNTMFSLWLAQSNYSHRSATYETAQSLINGTYLLSTEDVIFLEAYKAAYSNVIHNKPF